MLTSPLFVRENNRRSATCVTGVTDGSHPNPTSCTSYDIALITAHTFLSSPTHSHGRPGRCRTTTHARSALEAWRQSRAAQSRDQHLTARWPCSVSGSRAKDQQKGRSSPGPNTRQTPGSRELQQTSECRPGPCATLHALANGTAAQTAPLDPKPVLPASRPKKSQSRILDAPSSSSANKVRVVYIYFKLFILNCRSCSSPPRRSASTLRCRTSQCPTRRGLLCGLTSLPRRLGAPV